MQILFFFLGPEFHDLARILLLELVLEEAHVALHIDAAVAEVSKRRLKHLDGTLLWHSPLNCLLPAHKVKVIVRMSLRY